MPQIGKDEIYIGIMAADPLRSIGLQSILEEVLHVRAVILPDGVRPRGQKLHMLIVDQGFDRTAETPTHSSPANLPTPSTPSNHSLHAMPSMAANPSIRSIPSVPFSRALLHMPGVAVIVLTHSETQAAFDQILAAGARAVLPDTAQVSDIRACVRAVLRGKTWTPRERVSEEAPVPDSMPLSERLTPKEREVMQWLSCGQSNREIANTMGIDEATVKAHLGRMLRKGEASNRVELTLRSLAEARARLPETKLPETKGKG